MTQHKTAKGKNRLEKASATSPAQTSGQIRLQIHEVLTLSKCKTADGGMHLRVDGGDMGFVPHPITDTALCKAQCQKRRHLCAQPNKCRHPDGLSPHRLYDSHVLARWRQQKKGLHCGPSTTLSDSMSVNFHQYNHAQRDTALTIGVPPNLVKMTSSAYRGWQRPGLTLTTG